MTLSMAVLVGVAAEPARAQPGPAAPVQQPAPSPGAAGQKPGLAPVLVPGTLINRAVVGGASSGPWSGDSSQALPTDQPVDPSRQAKKPGLGTQEFYPLERRALGDRLETLVNLANGNLVVRATDMVFAGTGLNLGVSHFYNNQADNRGSFGKKWTMSTGRDVGLDTSDPGKVVLQGPSGYRQDYTRNGDSFTSPSGANAKLTKNDGGYELKFDKTKEKWNFDNNGFFVSQVDRNDNTINFNYNGNGTLASVKDTRQAVTNFEYDQAGRVTEITDPTGYEYGGYSYDDQGRHTGFTTPDGKRVEFGYDDAGNMTRIVDPNGNEYRFEYDDQRRVTKVDEPREAGVLTNDRAITTYQYVSDTETKGTAPNGGTTTYTFDDQGRQTKAEDPLGREESKTFTANSDVNTTTSVGGNVTTATFDPANRMIGTQLPTGAKNVFGYSDGANPAQPTSVTDPEGRQTTMTYDSKGNALSVKQAQTNQGVTRTYNDDGTVRDNTDGNGNKTSFSYDPDGRLVTVTPPAPRRQLRYEYDSRSRITAVTDGNGTTMEYSYDAADRVLQITQRSSTGPRLVQQTDYDPNGNRLANYHAGTTKRFTYSPRNQIMTDVRYGGLLSPTDSVLYTYDATNNLASLRDAGGITTYRYNRANDVTDLTDLAGRITRFSYDSDGNRTVTAYPNGQGQVQVFDKDGREVRSTSYAAGAAPQVRTTSYGKSGGGDTDLVQSFGDTNGTTARYSYDGSGRLLRSLYTNNSNGAVGADYRFSYDRAANITSFRGVSQSYNPANGMTSSGPSTQVLQDGQGNITSARNSAGQVVRSYEYSPTNQKTRDFDPGITYTVGYDTADSSQINRIDDRLSNGATFSYEFTQTALGMTGRVRAGQGRYSISRDPEGNPIMQRNPDGSTHYFETDRQGSIVGHTRGTDGTRGAYFHYDPYGNYDYTTGPDSSNADNFLGFQGGFFHSNMTNTQFGQRWYHAQLGRFTQVDPSGKEANVYGFTRGNPLNFTDPTGEDSTNVGGEVCYYLCLGYYRTYDIQGAESNTISVGIGVPSVSGGVILSTGGAAKNGASEVSKAVDASGSCAVGPISAGGTARGQSIGGISPSFSTPKCAVRGLYSFR